MLFFSNKAALVEPGIKLEYGSEREKEIFDWAETSGVVQKAKAMMEKILEIEKTSGPLPGPIEALRAWCLRKRILKNFWKKQR